jgi:Zn-dependent protease with chaperone function
MEYKVDKLEDVYFAIKVLFTILVLALIVYLIRAVSMYSSTLITLTTFLVYIVVIILFLLFQKIFLIGYLKGNGVQLSERQFPEVYREYQQMAKDLGIAKEPKLYIVQQGGALNAFAVRFSGSNYIAIFSDVFSLAQEDLDTVKFIIGHELAHIKRNHMSKRFWTCLSSLVPFLTAAYSRKCENTCDNIGYVFSRDNPYRGRTSTKRWT